MFEKVDNFLTKVAEKAEKFYEEHPTAAKLMGLGAAACIIYKKGYSSGREFGYNECMEDCLYQYIEESAKSDKPVGRKF